MISLPIDAHLPAIVAAVRAAGRVVVVAPPGSGKTTRLPPALLDAAGLLTAPHDQVLVLQPRRVAARAAADRIAAERGTRVGDEVGYQIRFERRVGPRTRLAVITEGILTRRLLVDPELAGVGAVVLDEFHERSIHVDLALGLVREVAETIRPDLKIVVMSATLDARRVADYLGGAPILEVAVPSHPVTVRYQPPADPRARLEDQVAAAVESVLAGDRDGGDVLVFLPGKGEIDRTGRRLAALAERRGVLVLPLHGSLPVEEQRRALVRAEQRKLVLATNVAETSLTIDGVTTVIDSGLARFADYDPSRGVDRLVLGKISRASAEQRAGRAGRTVPGVCIRLWAERDHRARPEFPTPEIHAVDLAATVLALHAWGYADPAAFAWFDAPAPDRLAAADRLLHGLGALESGRITELGRRLLALPLHPRLGRLLLEAADLGLLRAGATLAALLSERDIRRPARGGRAADRADRGPCDLLARWVELEHGSADLDRAAVAAVIRLRDELIGLVQRSGAGRGRVASGQGGQTATLAEAQGPGVADRVSAERLGRLLLRAYPDRLCRRRAPGSDRARMVGGRGVRQARESIARETELFLALDVHDESRSADLLREATVTLASSVQPHWLEEELPHLLSTTRRVRFDPARGQAVVEQSVCFADLVLRTETHAVADQAEAVEQLAEHAAEHAETLVRADTAVASWLDRLASVAAWFPDEGWPALTGERLAQWVRQAVVDLRATRWDQLRGEALLPWFRSYLGEDRQRLLDRLAPEAIEVPSGRAVRLVYASDGAPPVLAARLQELFGWHETPKVGGGRVAVVVHLLGPNLRPVQITSDLRSFWTNTYAQVRKDLRARYPKHAWPEDPWTAVAEVRGGRPRR
ncbi:MAG: ATP-dependent helicase HrpB [Isosphaeraceae bacterium]|jgi:ATP-dependent helicase HrpB|nr:MAG: ATP-dependent helicase HrpB [Isosphaeraceae bacterium]